MNSPSSSVSSPDSFNIKTPKRYQDIFLQQVKTLLHLNGKQNAKESIRLKQLQIDFECFPILSRIVPVKRGFLNDRSSKFLNKLSIVKIYTEIRGTTMIICSSEEINQAREYSQIKQIVDLCAVKKVEPIKENSFKIEFSTKCSKRTFQASSVSERDEWVRVLKKASCSLTLKNFDLIGHIGEGQFGNVFLAREKRFGNVVAIKEVQLNNICDITSLINERIVLGCIPQHPFILHLKAGFHRANCFYFVTSFACNGDLYTKMQEPKPLNKCIAILYAAEVLLALEHLHNHGVIYRDLKPENILLQNDGHILLADMGLCKVLGAGEYQTNTFCGTQSYLAPEIITKNPYGKEVDYWQFGCFVFELYCGQSPFYLPRKHRANQKALIGAASYSIPKLVPTAARSLINSLLKVTPSARLGCGENIQQGWCLVKQAKYFEKINFYALFEEALKQVQFDESIDGDKLASVKHCAWREDGGNKLKLRSDLIGHLNGFDTCSSSDDL